jgi:hypothetical protein
LQSAVARNVDVIGIFATPINPFGDLHCLTMRWISKPAIIRTPDDSQELFDYFWGLLSQAKGKMEISQVGGSNGNAHVSTEFLKMLHLPGITPRKSHGVMWYAVKTKWYFLYISPYKKEWKLCCRPYCQPLPGGQARISRTSSLNGSYNRSSGITSYGWVITLNKTIIAKAQGPVPAHKLMSEPF